MTKEKILLMIEKLLRIYEEMDNDIEENNPIEFMGEDENGNWLYRFKE